MTALHDPSHNSSRATPGIGAKAKTLRPIDEAMAAFAFARARGDAGISQKTAADLTGRSKALAALWEDPFDSASPRLLDLWRLPAKLLQSLAAQRAALDGPRTAPVLPMPLHALTVCARAGVLADETRAVFDDGEVSDEESARLEQRIRELESALATARDDLRRMKEER